MSVYARYKREPEGFRQLIELLEMTPLVRRQKMIDSGMQEDPEYTQKALEFIMNFNDLVGLPEPEMAELVYATPARYLASAIQMLTQEQKDRFIRCARAAQGGEVKEFMEQPVTPKEVSAAQYKMVELARDLERKGYVSVKRIPLYTPPKTTLTAMEEKRRKENAGALKKDPRAPKTFGRRS